MKSAPLRKSERASATAVSEQDDEARHMGDGFEALFERRPSANNVSSPTPLCVVTQELAARGMSRRRHFALMLAYLRY